MPTQPTQFETISTIFVPGGGFQNAVFSVTATFNATPGVYTFNIVATDGVSIFTSPQQIQVSSAPPSLVVNPVALTFDPTLDGATSTAQSITVTNPTGSAVAPFIVGPPANNQPAIGTFQETTTCGTTLGANSSCTVQVVFVASQPGTVTDQISVGGSVGFVLVPLSATAADIALQPAPGGTTSATIPAGKSAVFNLQIVPTLFQGAISFGCSGAPPKGGCTIPSSVNVSSSGVVPFQVTVTTAGSAPASKVDTRRFIDILKQPLGIVFTFLTAIMSLTVLRGICSDGRRIRRAFLVAFFCCAAIGLANCGGGGGGGGGGSTGTPPGTYLLTVTGSGGNATRSIQLTLTVTSN